ncbi:MAG: methyltransferase [Candidatus Devosia symbiotica]|nr:methyltransferase [Candidatus Devosia symbiotica]
MTITAIITSLGHKGEGVAEIDGRKIFVPLTLPGERVEIEIYGDRATLLGVIAPAKNRIAPFCSYFGACGGCQLQHMDRPIYEVFKTSLIETPLRFANIELPVSRFIDAAGNGRRRATLHARREGVGYMRLRSHEVHDIDACPILVPGLAKASDIVRTVFQAVGDADVSIVASLSGLDVAIRTKKKQIRTDRVAPLVARFKLARLALNGEIVLQAQPPIIEMGRARVELPIGSFLQATAEAEQVLSDYVLNALDRKAKTVADLFCGLGPFALRLAEQRPVMAFDNDKPSIAALDQARRFTKGLREVTAKSQDLFRDPLTQYELNYDFVVLDPPRSGAETQVHELAKSKVKTVVMAACNPSTFARDAATLIAGGYTMSDLVAVDQFTQSAHIEMAATFRR